MAVKSRRTKARGHRFPCYLCGSGKDEQSHIFGDCPVTRRVFTAASELTRLDIPLSSPSLLMLEAPTDHPLLGLIKVTLVWALWSQRTHYFSHLSQPPSHAESTIRVIDFFTGHIPTLKEKKELSLNRRITELALAPPVDTCIVGFSDGSALGNPGPTGAGVWVSFPPNPPISTHPTGFDISIAYSKLDNNNAGEMIGIKCLLESSRLLERTYSHPPRTMIFSDSLLCICYLTAGWPPPCETGLASSTRKIYRSRPRKDRPLLYWVRGHSAIPLNERVDTLAKIGANRAQSTSFTSPHIWIEGEGDPPPSLDLSSIQSLLFPGQTTYN